MLAVINTSFAADSPGTTKFNDFSEIPLNCGVPSPAILFADKLTPGLTPFGNPSIEDFGVNASLAITPSISPFTSIYTTSYSLLSMATTFPGRVPVAKPCANSGPTSTHPEPANK